jgi:hypothetical protein
MVEILIQIPPWVVHTWESLCSRGDTFYSLLGDYTLSLWNFLSNQRNVVGLGASMIIFWPLWVYFAVALSTASTWIFWLFASMLLGIIQLIYVTYQFCMIAVDVMVLTLLKTYQVLMRSRFTQYIFFFSKRIRHSRLRTSRRREWKKNCDHANTYSEFLQLSVLESKAAETEVPISPTNKKPMRSLSYYSTLKTLYEEEQQDTPSPSPTKRLQRQSSFDRNKLHEYLPEDGVDSILKKEFGNMTSELLLSTTARLKEARQLFSGDTESNLEFLLSGVAKRNHLSMEDLLVNDARSVANAGQYEFSSPSRTAIATYYDEVEKGLDCLAEAPVSDSSDPLHELGGRMTLVRKMKQNMGRTALMLSGGGAQAMYHLGTVRALVESNIYDDIKVISGTSGGSITAACCAMHTAEELYETICITTVSTDYRLNGEMKRKNIRWFPKVMDMGAYWMKNRLLVDSKVSSTRQYGLKGQRTLSMLTFLVSVVLFCDLRVLLWHYHICGGL